MANRAPKPPPQSTETVDVILDLNFSTPDGIELLLDLYIPKAGDRPLPLIIWLHGGGWRFGDRRLAPDLIRYFAESGYAMASIDYRLSADATYPAQIHDVKAAIRWLRAHADQYGLDRNQFGLWGSSAGAHLGSIVALAGANHLESDDVAHPDQPVDVQAVVDGYGPTDFLQMDAHRKPIPPEEEDPESIRVPPEKRTADADSFESILIGAPITERPELVQAASPLAYIRKQAPPFLILHGLSDSAVPSHQSELLFNSLAAQDNDVTLYLIKGLGHGFLNRNDFDQNPRLATVKQKESGQAEKSFEGQSFSFATIKRFFDQHLRP